MALKNRKISIALTFVLIFSISQVYVHADLNDAKTTATNSTLMPMQETVGQLTVGGRRTVLVNGNPAGTGTTLLSGSTIEMPDGVGATVRIGSLGSVDLAPNTRAIIEFSDGTIKVRLVSGCMILRTMQRVNGSVETADRGEVGRTDPTKNDMLDVCYPPGAVAPIIGQGAAVNAGAGAMASAGTAAGTTATAASAPGLFGLGTAGSVVLGAAALSALVATAVIITPCRRGQNPSPGEPRGRNDECRE